MFERSDSEAIADFYRGGKPDVAMLYIYYRTRNIERAGPNQGPDTSLFPWVVVVLMAVFVTVRSFAMGLV